MNTLDLLLNTNIPLKRVSYFVNVTTMTAFAVGMCAFVFKTMAHHHHFFPLSIFICIVVTLWTICNLVMLSIRRLKDANLPSLMSIFIIVPFLNILFFLYLSFTATRR